MCDKIKYLAGIAAICIFCVVTTSCGQDDLKDFSSVPEFSRVIGKTFKTKEDLWAIGVTADDNYKKRVDYIVLYPFPGASGPEVVSKEIYKQGSIIRVVKVLKGKNVVYIVEDLSDGKFQGITVRTEVSGNVDDPNFGLSEAIYQRME